MQKGEVVQVGAPLEVYRRPVNTFVARFLGGPPMNLIPAELQLANTGAVVRLDPLLIGLDLPPRPAPIKAGAVTLGIRPEDIYEAPPVELRATAAAMPVRVVAVEPLGAETLVVVRLANSNTEVIARVGRDSRFVAGATSTIFLDLARIHLFDPVTTAAITDFTVRPTGSVA
jgi:multiple sugar transport system ATP-binding protein